MSKKDEFVRMWSERARPGYNLSDVVSGKTELKNFVTVLNANPELCKLFREAVAEAKEEASNPATGLATLFGQQ